ncbi:MAG: type II secretion system major pseudopilin GspG [Zetaproteobacteria bacterium]|nr:type II secretion system major pseudopilin GspG [Zetaproteobacteria bacterium]
MATLGFVLEQMSGCYARVRCLALRPFGQGPARYKRGMTLIEIMIVITIVVTLMGILARQFSGQSDRAKEDQARIAMANLGQALDLYRVHNNRYPTTEQGLSALLNNPDGGRRWRGPYVDGQKSLSDPFGTPFDYQSDGRTYEITSAGIDLTIGTDTDIHFPERDEGGS